MVAFSDSMIRFFKGAYSKRAIAAAVSALAAVIIATAVVGKGCNLDSNTPKGVVGEFVRAANMGDRQGVFRLIGPTTKARLAQAADCATEVVGGDRRFDPLDLIGLSSPNPAFVIKRLTVRDREKNSATIDVLYQGGEVASIYVVRSNGTWMVEIPEYF